MQNHKFVLNDKCIYDIYISNIIGNIRRITMWS